jgi:hypothetical protein
MYLFFIHIITILAAAAITDVVIKLCTQVIFIATFPVATHSVWPCEGSANGILLAVKKTSTVYHCQVSG